MRKFIFMTIIVALMGSAGYYLWKKTHLHIEDVIPRDPLFYLHVTDVKDNWDVVRKGDVWQALAKLNYDALLVDKSIPVPAKAAAEFIKNSVDQPLNDPIFNNLFSKEVAIAVYPTNLTFMSSADMASVSMPLIIQRLMANVFFVTRVSPKVQAIDVFAKALKVNETDHSVTNFKYKNHTIYTFTSKKTQFTFSAVVIKDLMVAGVGTASPQRAVDISYSSELPLSEDKDYIAIHSKKTGSEDLFVYSNLEEVSNIVRGYLKGMMGAQKEQSSEMGQTVDELTSRMAGVIGASFAVDVNEPQMAFDLFFDKEQVNTEFSSFYLKCTPQKNRSVSFIPQDIVAYQWQGCLDFPEIWKLAVKEATGDGAVPLDDSWKTFAGVDLEKELLPVLGDEVGGYLKDIQNNGLFPFPRLALFIKVKDAQAVDGIIKRIVDEKLFGVEVETYQDHSIQYVKTPLGDALKPAYTHIGDYLVISPSDELIKRSIDVSKDPAKSFVSDKAYSSSAAELDQPSTFVQVIKTSVLLKQMSEVFEFFNDWVTAQDRQNEALHMSMVQKVNDLRKLMVDNVEKIHALEKDQRLLEDEIWNLESQALDAKGKKDQLAKAKDEVAQLKILTEGSQKEEKELLSNIESISKKAPATASRRVFLDEAVYPLIDAFKNVNATVVRSTLEGQVFHTVVHFK